MEAVNEVCVPADLEIPQIPIMTMEIYLQSVSGPRIGSDDI